jgi:hypothetical protein
MNTTTPTTTPTPMQQREALIGGMVTTLKTNVQEQVILTSQINNSGDDAATKAVNRSTVLTPLEQDTAILGQSIKGVYDFGERIIRALGVG